MVVKYKTMVHESGLAGPDPGSMLSAADVAGARVRRAGRWYVLWLAVFALYTVAELATVPFWHGGRVGVFAALGIVVFVYAMHAWAARQRVRVATGNWWVAPWIVLNLAVLLLVGPRLFPGQVGWYAVAGFVNAAPVLIEAVRVWRKSR